MNGRLDEGWNDWMDNWGDDWTDGLMSEYLGGLLLDGSLDVKLMDG